MNLHVTNGYKTYLQGLARNKALLALSQKRITKATREALREKYRDCDIQVSCTAEKSPNGWRGTCIIRGVQFEYRISK